MRTVLHADMDAFFAAIEQRDDPGLRGKPVVVGGASARGVVAAASYEAREFGIHSAMPSLEARRRCPDLIFVRGRMGLYRRESRRIFEIFRRFTPVVEGLSVDEAFLDLTGTEQLLGPPATVGRRLREEVREETGLAVSVGIAPVKMVAKIASELAKPDGLLQVAPDEVGAFLGPLPVGSIWGIGPTARRRLERAGILTIGDLARASDEVLARDLGEWGVAAARLARGEDRREVEPYREAKSYSEENTFERDVADRAELEKVIRAHAEAVARRLRRDGVRGRGVTVKLKLARGLGGGKYPVITRSATLQAPTDDGDEIARVGRSLLARAQLREPVRLLGVSVSRLEPPVGSQLPLLEEKGRGPEARGRLNRVSDAIRERFGERSLSRGLGTVERAGLSLQIKRGEEGDAT